MKANVSCEGDALSWVVVHLKSKGLVPSFFVGLFGVLFFFNRI